MEIDDRLNKKSPNYLPTYEELKLPADLLRRLETEWDDPIKHERNDREYQGYVLRWQQKHKERLILQASLKKEREKINLATHWYVTLHKEEIEDLIEQSRKLADKVFRGKQTSIPRMAAFYSDLHLRVLKGIPRVFPATSSKLKSFPKYDPYTKSLTGSKTSFIRLWIHVFSVRFQKEKGDRLSTLLEE